MSSAGEMLAWINYWKPKDEWYYLPKSRREALLRQWEAIRMSTVADGARQLGTYECRANTAWARVSLWQFPDLDLLVSMVERLEDASYYEYFAEDNTFGLPTDDPYQNYLLAADATVGE